MRLKRTITMTGGLTLTAFLALAQYAPVAPPAPPAPMAAQAPQAMPAPPATPVAIPMPPIPPVPAMEPMMDVMPLADLATDISLQINDQVQTQLDKVASMSFDMAFQENWLDGQAKAVEKMAQAQAKIADNFNFNAAKAPVAMQMARAFGSRGSDDSVYNNGLRAIDNHQYDQALTEFNNVVSRGGSRAEGGLYWKAYVQNKLGKAADAQATIDTLRKTYPNSRWLDDAKALELEVKQSKGPVSPDAESDEDLKVLALNGLMQSDPDRALPQVEKMLHGSYSPNLKRQALYVIAQSNTPRAQQLLEQTARGGNPDLQVRAIQFLSSKRNPNSAQLLLEIYQSSSDSAVKRAILDTFNNSRDKDRLFAIARSEKDAGLRASAISRLGDSDGQPELWQMYQGEQTSEGKIAILEVMRHNGNVEKLTEVARSDKDPKVRQKAIEVIATQDSGTPSSVLVTLYSSEQDEKVKQTIINNVSNSRNCKPLVDIARAEKNLQLKVRIVQRLASETKSCPAANDYLTEILNK